MNLSQVVQHGHQLPLSVDLLLASQGESLDADAVIDVTEDRFDDPKPHAVDMTAHCAIDLLFHPFQGTVLLFGEAADLDIDLPCPFLFGTAQAL